MKSYHIRCRNATTIIHFIVTAKIQIVTKSISAETAVINLHPNDRGRRRQIIGGCIRLAPCAERLLFCITIMSIIQTTAALTKSATIPFSYGSPLLLPLRLCQPFSANTISSVCVIPFKLSSRLCQCFISARILFGMSGSYLKLPLILRSLICKLARANLNSFSELYILMITFFIVMHSIES